MFEQIYMRVMFVGLVLSLIIAPIGVLTIALGIIEVENAFSLVLCILFTLVDIGLLIWKAKGWYKHYKLLMLYCLMAAILLLCAPPLIKSKVAVHAYAEGRRMIAEGAYEEAWSYLYPYTEEDDATAKGLVQLCNACIAYQEGDIIAAYDGIRLYYDIMPIDSQHPDDSLIYSRIRSDYLAEMDARALKRQQEEQQRLEEEARQREEAERKLRIEENQARQIIKLTGMPYVGMPETLIDETHLGKHSDSYDFKRLGATYTNYIFSKDEEPTHFVCCRDDKVNKIWDLEKQSIGEFEEWRDTKITLEHFQTAPRKSSTSASGKISKASTSKAEEDPFNAADYYDPEDFYDDYYDDFYDYYDAEDYFYEHTD